MECWPPFFFSQLNVGNNARPRHHRICLHFRRFFHFFRTTSLLFVELPPGMFGFISASVLFCFLLLKADLAKERMSIPCELTFLFVSFLFSGLSFSFVLLLFVTQHCVVPSFAFAHIEWLIKSSARVF